MMTTRDMTRYGIRARLLEMADRLEARGMEGVACGSLPSADQARDVLDALALRNIAESLTQPSRGDLGRANGVSMAEGLK